ncbi:MAG: nucleotide exchange factor GrpE [Robiginitomaculum sp.]
MTKKPTKFTSDIDALPTDAELNALQVQIDKAARAAENRKNNPDDNDGGIKPELSTKQIATARIKELETELATLKDQALRALAEADNVKKRAEREVKAANIYGIERFSADMLSVFDNLGRALGGLDEETRKSLGDNAKNLLEGIELTQKELISVFSRHDIKPVSGKGSKFDPNIHQAVAQISSTESKGDVAEVMQIGFTLGDRTLRAAMVAVSTGPVQA